MRSRGKAAGVDGRRRPKFRVTWGDVAKLLAGSVLALLVQLLVSKISDSKRVHDLRSAMLVELIPNQNVLRWRIRMSKVESNLIWYVVHCDPNRIGMMSPEGDEVSFGMSVYERIKPDLHLLGLEDMQLVEEYYSSLRALGAERKRLDHFYEAKQHEWYIRQFFATGYLPISERAYEIGAYMLAKYGHV